MHLLPTLSSVLALGIAFVVADLTMVHTPQVAKRGDFCGLWDRSATHDGYTVSNNLWGHQSGNGQQCTGVDGYNKGGITWHTEWSWSGSNQAVKSFANVDVHIDQPAKLCTIKSIPSHWTWSYNTQSITADVAYDLFSSSSAQGHQEFELMIWLAQLGGAGPISYTYGANGHPTPLVSNVQLGGYSWNLYKGTNGVQTVFSFVINQGPLTSFEGDVLSFWNYLIQHQGFDRNQFLITAQAGTEPFQGQNARLTNTFKLRIHNH